MNFKSQLEEAAQKYEDEILADNPSGFDVAPYVNGDVLGTAFYYGAKFAMQSEVVRGLVYRLEFTIKALEAISGAVPALKNADEVILGKHAITAFEQAKKELE